MKHFYIEAIRNKEVRYVQKSLFVAFVTELNEATFTNKLEVAITVCRFLTRLKGFYETQDTFIVRDIAGQAYFSIDQDGHETILQEADCQP